MEEQEKERSIPGYLQRKDRHYNVLSALLMLTLLFNFTRGLLSLSYGMLRGNITLIGFGIDAFIELAYGIAVWALTQRIKEGYSSSLKESEEKILKACGILLYLLSAGITLFAVTSIAGDHKPASGLLEILIAAGSIGIIFILSAAKTGIAQKLKSEVLSDDASYTKITMLLAIILLFSSLGYQLTNISAFDSGGAILLSCVLLIKGYQLTRIFR